MASRRAGKRSTSTAASELKGCGTAPQATEQIRRTQASLLLFMKPLSAAYQLPNKHEDGGLNVRDPVVQAMLIH